MLGEAMSGVLSGEGGELVEVEVDEGVVVAVSVHDAGELAFEVGDGLLALACGDVGVCVARRRRGHRSSPASARSWRMPRMVAGSMSARANHPASWSTFSASAVSSSMSVSFSVVAVGAGVACEEPSDDGGACEVGGDGVVEDGLGGHGCSWLVVQPIDPPCSVSSAATCSLGTHDHRAVQSSSGSGQPVIGLDG